MGRRLGDLRYMETQKRILENYSADQVLEMGKVAVFETGQPVGDGPVKPVHRKHQVVA